MGKGIVASAAALLLAATPALAQLEGLTASQAAAGLKAALEHGARAAVATLGRRDGFLGNPKVKIPLPDSLQRAEKTMRRVGLARPADELILAMNRAAEAAVPQAQELFADALRKMTLRDAKAILAGGQTAGTDYFRRTTHNELRRRFLPIVQRATSQVGLAQYYDQYAGTAVMLGLMKKQDADLDAYVTEKALDGLYYTVAEEEKKIRRDPLAAGEAIVRRVFGALQ